MNSLISRMSCPGRPKSMHSVVEEVASRRSGLRLLSDAELRNRVNDLRESVCCRTQTLESIALDAQAIAKDAIQRVLGLELYDVQLLASGALIQKQIAEMQTGEGKTMAAVPAAVYGGVLGGGVHLATPNCYLAERDYTQLRHVYELLGLSVGILDTEPGADHREAYACDITYGPGYEFGFDYLRDQILLKRRNELPLGTCLIDSLLGNPMDVPVQIRGLQFAIVDEADNVLVDDASSPQVLSEFQPGEAPDRDAVHVAQRVATNLSVNHHYRESGTCQLELTQSGIDAIHGRDILIPVDQLVRPWTKYVEAALRARHQFHRDIHYVVDENNVRIVDESTGRIFLDRTWQSGLHQAIEAKEGLPVSPESLPLAQITRQRFYRLFRHLSGMTGTASQCRGELHSIYGLGIVEIPLRLPSQRRHLGLRTFDHQQRKWQAITASIVELHRCRRPVLVGTRTIRESLLLADLLKQANLPFDLLNGRQDADEADVVARAGQAGAITIATNLAGRGTDIKLQPGVGEMGGLHVIVSECHASARVDRQLIGRCARQGDPGSCQTFVSADDWLFTVHGPWLADCIRRMASHGEVEIDLEPKIRRIQQQIESREFSQRFELMRTNERQHRILHGVPS